MKRKKRAPSAIRSVEMWRRTRVTREMSWRELSQRTGIPISTLFGWLEEGRRLSIEGAIALERVLGEGLGKEMPPGAPQPPGASAVTSASVPFDDPQPGLEVRVSYGSETFGIVRVPIDRLRLRSRIATYRVSSHRRKRV